jgi:sRNA-binding carbon storage regulator CsrA
MNRSDKEVVLDTLRHRGLVLDRRNRESLFLEGPAGDRAYVTVLDVDHGRAALRLDLPQVGSLVLFLDARGQGHAKLQIDAPQSIQILRTECASGERACPQPATACC